MKITDRLSGDHKTFRKMGGDMDALVQLPLQARDPKKLLRLVELFRDHVVLHAWFEDQFYYPAVRRALAGQEAPPVNEAYLRHLEDEHKTLDGYLDRLERAVKARPPVPAWPQMYALFWHGLKVHMRKEEEELFPASERLLGAGGLEALSVEMEKRRKEAPPMRLHTRAEM